MSYANVEEQAQHPKNPLDDRPRQILLVDDEPNVLSSLSKVIGDTYGEYVIATATSAEEALRVFDDSTVDLLITDLKLPEMDGLSLAKSTHERFPETRSILMTAFGTNQVHCDAYRYGCVAYLEKPFDIDHLLRSIDETLVPTVELGDYGEPEIAEVVQSFALNSKDVTIRISQGTSAGLLFLRAGKIRFAEFDGLTDHAALVAMLACRKPIITASPGAPEVSNGAFSVPWQSLTEASRCRSVAEQFRVVRSGKSTPNLEEVLDGRVINPEEETSFGDILTRFRRRANLIEDKPENFFRSEERDTYLRRSLSAEYRQRQNRLRKLVNSGVEHFRIHDFEKARRCWLAALRLDPNCQQAKRNIAVVRKLLGKHELN